MEEVVEAIVAAGFEVWNYGFELAGDKYGGVIWVYGDHAKKGRREGTY
jgi:hypothetical protein